MHLPRTLLIAAAALPAVGCATDAEPAPSFAAVTCDLGACVDDADAPLALAVDGALWLSVSAAPGEDFKVRASDSDLLSFTLVGNAVDLYGLAPGPVELELLDARGDVVDDLAITVIAPDRLVARMRWVDAGTQEVRDAVLADQPTTVPANAAVGITVTPHLGAFPLAGLIDYEITAALPDGATLDTSGMSETILLARTGDHAVTYRTGSLSQRFVVDAVASSDRDQ